MSKLLPDAQATSTHALKQYATTPKAGTSTQQEISMPVGETSIHCLTETQLINSIKENPSSRAHFVELANFLESNGLEDHARMVFRGNLPQSLQDRHQLDPYPHKRSVKMESCQRLSWYGEEQIALTPPRNKDSMRNSVFMQECVKTNREYVDVMSNCTLVYDSRNCLYVDEAGTRNSEHSTANSYLLIPRARELPPQQRLSGLTLLFTARNTHNFYHWHFDWLPKLGLLEAAGISINDIDTILMDKKTLSFQLQTLYALGVKESQLRFIDPQNFHAQCETALMVRLENKQGMAQSRRHIDWLRSKLLPIACSSAGSELTGTKKIAIERSNRGFSDPGPIYKSLSERGYTCIQLENLPYLEQVSLFAHATHVVAPHGAGLSLLAYAKPGTQVHEFYGDHVQPCFWSLSSALGHDYHNYNCSLVTDGHITSSNNKTQQYGKKTTQVLCQSHNC